MLRSATPEVVAAVEVDGVLRTRLPERPLVELELRLSHGSEPDMIELLEPPKGREYVVGDEILYHHERWRVDSLAAPTEESVASQRLICSRVLR